MCECCGACSALSLPLINDLQKLDTKIDKDTQVIDSKCCRSIENPRVGGSIPPLGTIFTNKNSDLDEIDARLSCVNQKHTLNTLFAVLLTIFRAESLC